MTVLFFVWGFMTVWNDILIPRFKEAFALDYFQAMLVQFAFFGAYGFGSLVYFAISITSGDPINRIGYKNGVLIGLLMAALGSALFVPGAILGSYPLFLTALFVVGLGFAMLQIAANPYVTILGPEATASSRLNLSQAFNSLGTTIGPLVAGYLIFGLFNRPGISGAASVKIPYLCLAGVFVLLAIAFTFFRLPAFTNPERITGWGALRYRHTAFGIGAIFMYVGGEVTVGSSLVSFLRTSGPSGLSYASASKYLSFYWGGLMIGRFMGAFALSDIRRGLRNTFVTLVPIAAFTVVAVLPSAASCLSHVPFFAAFLDPVTVANIGRICGFSSLGHFGVLLCILLLAFFAGESSPQRMLALFGTLIVALLITGMATSGETAQWAILGVGLFCSVMWSNIFALAIEGLGPLKGQASALLIMAILGGAVLPPIQGAFADQFGLSASYLVPVVAFSYIVFFGLYGYRAGREGTAGPMTRSTSSPRRANAL
jgi:FHS family L-fucose permease-like MFS transporter